MVLVVQAVNASLGNDPARSLPIEAIGIIIGVDRILDMVRTMVNVQGDMIGARLLTRLAPD
jgi:Na+/H+-dicarboxylate symporter